MRRCWPRPTRSRALRPSWLAASGTRWRPDPITSLSPTPHGRGPGKEKPPAERAAGGLRDQPAEIRRSGQEVSLDAEHDAQDVLVVQGDRAGRTGAVVDRLHTRALERRVQVRPQHVNTDVEVRMRVPLR